MGGVPPKDPKRRARNNKDPIPTRVVDIEPMAPPPDLPADLIPADEQWHPATLRWWKRWCESPLAAQLPAVDWSELEALAAMHHMFMTYRYYSLAAELRLRMAKFGATPEDRARLRIQIATADEKDGQRPGERETSSSRQRRGTLHTLPEARTSSAG